MKRYIAILNQNGQNAPVATVLENSLGPIVWSRSQAGQYLGTLNGAFPIANTTALAGRGQGGEVDTIVALDLPANSENYVSLTTKDVLEDESQNFFDGLLIRTTVEIRVYE